MRVLTSRINSIIVDLTRADVEDAIMAYVKARGHIPNLAPGWARSLVVNLSGDGKAQVLLDDRQP